MPGGCGGNNEQGWGVYMPAQRIAGPLGFMAL